MNKTISIIIPTYNRAPYLKKILTQLLRQTEIPEEIIVVDDHSTDQTASLVKQLSNKYPQIRYCLNKGRYQRDGKKTGLGLITKNYISFMDDDVLIEDTLFFKKLKPHLNEHSVIQAKIILENMGKKNKPNKTLMDCLSFRPYPILEATGPDYNAGSHPRHIYPTQEAGNFWPAKLKHYFIDNNLIKDGYGESYASSLRLYQAGIKLILIPSLVVRHPGANTGGSNRFYKQNMLKGFTEFHYGYFYNMVYMHARWLPYWIWLWLPYFVGKSLIALLVNKQFINWRTNAWQPIVLSLNKHFRERNYIN
jgi:glycosyltransferase involved in cell wall biosynthesis